MMMTSKKATTRFIKKMKSTKRMKMASKRLSKRTLLMKTKMRISETL